MECYYGTRPTAESVSQPMQQSFVTSPNPRRHSPAEIQLASAGQFIQQSFATSPSPAPAVTRQYISSWSLQRQHVQKRYRWVREGDGCSSNCWVCHTTVPVSRYSISQNAGVSDFRETLLQPTACPPYLRIGSTGISPPLLHTYRILYMSTYECTRQVCHRSNSRRQSIPRMMHLAMETLDRGIRRTGQRIAFCLDFCGDETLASISALHSGSSGMCNQTPVFL
ncbi:hypothetical protein BZA05DRAFT_394791 [Tricharina praecox]|uniref:uncharacterized protein n=1 Tax=Tricharina praecox TaxID=43433 RepID=UPI00221EB38C|nr:uncharacterized protein BZA05DRAFT_394791 [Tricharina praecox]KAI5853810.1 hypothetical protein BZA05DRAFT_394791 [Tricharina praecox]